MKSTKAPVPKSPTPTKPGGTRKPKKAVGGGKYVPNKGNPK